MSTHTKEPWVSHEFRICAGVNTNYLSVICDTGWNARTRTTQAKANASRIVACVNALAGMNPAALAGVVEAARNLTCQISAEGRHGFTVHGYSDKLKQALSALTNGAEVPAPPPVNAELLAAAKKSIEQFQYMLDQMLTNSVPYPNADSEVATRIEELVSAISRADAQGAAG